ncbi:MAG: hypothetical protein KGH69_01240 [Candidatus Micrarchaeota archaeon]|nr:hypothetical protein [Candidatus Micrarchaeota archaeon]
MKANPKIILPYFVFTALVGMLSIYFSLSLAGSVKGAGVNTIASFVSVLLVMLVRLAPLLISVTILGILVTPLIVGMYIDIADQGCQKKTVSLRKAFEVAKSNYSNMFLLSILVTIIWIVVFAVLGVVFALPALMMGAGTGGILLLIVGAIVSIVVLAVLSIYLYEAYAVVVLERLGPIRAVRRSLQIGRQKLGLLFKVLVLTVLVAIGFVIADGILVGVVEVVLGLSGHSWLGLGIGQTLNFLFSSAFSAWIIMIPVVFYKEYVGKGKAAKGRRK